MPAGLVAQGNREKMPMGEIVRLFDLPQILRHNARFDLDKLNWLEGRIVARDSPMNGSANWPPQRWRGRAAQSTSHSTEYVRAAAGDCKGKVKRLGELPAYAGFYFVDEVKIDLQTIEKEFPPEAKARVKKLRDAFQLLTEFNAASIEQALKATAAQLGVKTGLLVHPARMACTGNTAGPSLYHLMEVLGKGAVIKRLDRVMNAERLTPRGPHKRRTSLSLDFIAC